MKKIKLKPICINTKPDNKYGNVNYYVDEWNRPLKYCVYNNSSTLSLPNERKRQEQ